MSIVLTTWKRELMSYFFNPVAYVILVLFYLIRGMDVQGLTRAWVQYDQDVDKYPGIYMLGPWMGLMLLLIPPILTMRCFAEERRTGSLEVLLTAPVRDTEIVLGKWLASATFFAVLWLPSLVILYLLTTGDYLATRLPVGPVLSGYVGIMLFGGMLLAIGCFTSSLTDNQLVASLAAILVNGALLLAPTFLTPLLRDQMAEHEWIGRALEQLNVYAHLKAWFAEGLIDTSRVVFFLAVTGLFLFLTVKSLEARAWR